MNNSILRKNIIKKYSGTFFAKEVGVTLAQRFQKLRIMICLTFQFYPKISLHRSWLNRSWKWVPLESTCDCIAWAGGKARICGNILHLCTHMNRSLCNQRKLALLTLLFPLGRMRQLIQYSSIEPINSSIYQSIHLACDCENSISHHIC